MQYKIGCRDAYNDWHFLDRVIFLLCCGFIVAFLSKFLSFVVSILMLLLK